MHKKTFEEFLKETPDFDCPEVAQIRLGFRDSFGLDVTCLPADDPLLGEVGYILFNTINGEEKCVLVRRRFGPVADGVKLTTKQDIEKEYNLAIEHDQMITRCDDPVKRLAGFIVSRGSGRRWYHISIQDLMGTSGTEN